MWHFQLLFFHCNCFSTSWSRCFLPPLSGMFPWLQSGGVRLLYLTLSFQHAVTSFLKDRAFTAELPAATVSADIELQVSSLCWALGLGEMLLWDLKFSYCHKKWNSCLCFGFWKLKFGMSTFDCRIQGCSEILKSFVWMIYIGKFQCSGKQ